MKKQSSVKQKESMLAKTKELLKAAGCGPDSEIYELVIEIVESCSE